MKMKRQKTEREKIVQKQKQKKEKPTPKQEPFSIIAETKDLITREELARFRREQKLGKEAFAAQIASIASYGFLGILRSLAAAGVSNETLGEAIRLSHELAKDACMADYADIEGLLAAYAHLLNAIAEEKPFHGLGISPEIIAEHRDLVAQATMDLLKLDAKRRSKQ